MKVKKGILSLLFTSNARVNILEYLFFSKKETYLREIVRDLKISPSAVKRELDNLFSIGLIKKVKSKIILNEANPILNDLRKIFLKTDSINYPILEALNKEKIKFSLIFGSFASNCYDSESDVDLLVIGDVKQEKIFRLLRPVEKLVNRDINPVVWTLEELGKNRKKGFIQDIVKKDRLMIIGDENEFQGIIK